MECSSIPDSIKHPMGPGRTAGDGESGRSDEKNSLDGESAALERNVVKHRKPSQKDWTTMRLYPPEQKLEPLQ